MKSKLLLALVGILVVAAVVLFWSRKPSIAPTNHTTEPNAVATSPIAAPALPGASGKVEAPAPPPAAPAPSAVAAAPMSAGVAALAMPGNSGSNAAPKATADAASPTAPATAPGAVNGLPVGAEVAATRRMVAAHAPLRTPEVADPDSATNRKILQTMVEKAILRADAKPAAPSNAGQ